MVLLCSDCGAYGPGIEPLLAVYKYIKTSAIAIAPNNTSLNPCLTTFYDQLDISKWA